MGLRMRFVAAVFALLLAACGQPQPATYTPEYELNFMRSCQSGGAGVAVCSCTWRKIADEVPVSDFDALEQLPEAERATHPLMLQIQGYATACRAGP
jgi:hypothetical protein